MSKPFDIPGKFSIDLAEVASATYDQDDKKILVEWKDPKKVISGLDATPEDFAEFQKAFAKRTKAAFKV